MLRQIPRLLFGPNTFSETEEFLEFQFKFVCALMFVGGFFGIMFLTTNKLGLTPVGPYHKFALELFSILSFTLWALLRKYKRWFMPLAWCSEAVVISIAIAAWVLVPQDELRVIWLYVNLPAVFIVLGRRAGVAVTAVTMLILVFGNQYQQVPYSVHALFTAIVSMGYLSLLLYVQGTRLSLYFARMRASNEQLHRLAVRDPLTDLLNARAYNEVCTSRLQQAQRASVPSAVLFIDLDHFKVINDSYGHLAGDEVLKAVSNCLNAHVRKTDVLGRIGGEEFCAFLPSTSSEGAMALAEGIRSAIESLMPEVTSDQSEQTTQRIKVTASIGVTSSMDWRESMQVMQRRADAAMYSAKQAGRNRVSFIAI